MFESDQHEFDEEYDDLSAVAPPPPVVKAVTPAAAPVTVPVAAPAAAPKAVPNGTYATTQAPQSAPSRAPVAVAEPIVEEAQEEEAEEPQYEEEEQQEFVDPAQGLPAPPEKKKPNLVLIGGVAAVALIGILVALTYKPKDQGPPPGDMGPGIVAVSGLRGHLNTRWDGNTKTGRLVYQLHIEPMEDRWQAGFSKVALNAPGPISVNLRLLDATGFALCGKEIDLGFDPLKANVPVSTVAPVGSNGKRLSLAERTAAIQAARQSEIAQMQAAEAARERGKDVFQNQLTNDGQVSAMNVQGALPCSPDQFKVASYWDFNTNFPTLDEQAMLLDPKAYQRLKELEAPAHSAKRNNSKLPQEGFVIQGDDRVTGYDSAHGLLWAEGGRTFAIDRRYGLATATAWANNNSLIHYRCDQQANCALTAAGGTAVLHARLSD